MSPLMSQPINTLSPCTCHSHMGGTNPPMCKQSREDPETGTLLLSECPPDRKTNLFENADDVLTTLLTHSYSIIPDICSSGEHPNHKLQMVFQQCVTMGNYLLSNSSW